MHTSSLLFDPASMSISILCGIYRNSSHHVWATSLPSTWQWYSVSHTLCVFAILVSVVSSLVMFEFSKLYQLPILCLKDAGLWISSAWWRRA
jgi:hypothetical protein